MTTPQPLVIMMLLALSAPCVAIAQAQQAPAVSPADEASLRSVEDQERGAVLNRDIDALKRIWSEQLIVNAPGNQVSPNRDVPLGLMQKGLIDYSLFERSIEAMRVDGDTAFVMGAETIKPTGKSPMAGQTVRRRFTHVWKRHGETWRLVARHANILPPT